MSGRRAKQQRRADRVVQALKLYAELEIEAQTARRVLEARRRASGAAWWLSQRRPPCP